MIAAVFTQGQGFAIKEVPVPGIGDDEILVRVQASSICGTDVRTIRNGHRKLNPGDAVVLGHEFAGIVAGVGGRVTGYAPGMRVGVAPNMGCGRCGLCARGLPNMCSAYSAFGITLDGAHTEYVRIPQAALAQGSVVPLPEGLSWEEASLIEPLSCVVNGIRASRIELGDIVAVFGAGPIGLMHLMVARASGASRIVMIDVAPERLERAQELGASAVIDSAREDVGARIGELTGGRGADAAITACSVKAVQQQALALLAPYGRLCLFGGLPKDDPMVAFDANAIHYKNLVVTGVTGGAPADFRTALNLIAGGRVDVRHVISHVIARQEMHDAFDLALRGAGMKIVIKSGD